MTVTPPNVRRQSVVLATVCGVLFLTFLDNTIVSVALANMESTLAGAGVYALQWIMNGYALTFAAFMMVGGTLGDLFGRRKVMLGGVAVFCAGSTLAALAPNPGTLIAGRVVMGLGAAASEPGTLSVLRHAFPEQAARSRAIGVWVAVSATALAFGPVIGSALVGFSGWRAVFWFNLGFGALAFVLALLFVAESADPVGRRLDVVGLMLGTGSLVAGAFGVIAGEQKGYGTWWIVTLFVVAVTAGAAFVAYERRAPDPVLRLEFFRRPTFTASNIVAFTAFFGVFAIFFLVALYLQLVVRQSAYHMALDFVPMVAGMILASLSTGSWVGRAGPRWPMTIGCLLAAGGTYALDAVLSPQVTSGVTQTGVSFAALAWPLALAGIGFGMALVPATSAALAEVPPERSGMAASTTNTSRELGAVFGVAVLGAIATSELNSHLNANLAHLGIPPAFRAIAGQAISSGGISFDGSTPSSSSPLGGVVGAAEQAFYSGVNVALLVAGSMLAAIAVVACLMVRPRPTTA